MAVILDIETVAIDGAQALTEPVSAPGNYKDADKIAGYIARAEREQIGKAALYPWTARIVALGLMDDAGTLTVHLCRDEAQEAAALCHCWSQVESENGRFVQPIVGFNHRSFDLPVLMARSLLLGVRHPSLNLDRYRTPHIDLMDKLTWYGAVPARSLKWFARRFGLPVEDAIGGADIAGLIAAGDWQTVEAHCASDVRLTRALAEWLNLIRRLQVTV